MDHPKTPANVLMPTEMPPHCEHVNNKWFGHVAKQESLQSYTQCWLMLPQCQLEKLTKNKEWAPKKASICCKLHSTTQLHYYHIQC